MVDFFLYISSIFECFVIFIWGNGGGDYGDVCVIRWSIKMCFLPFFISLPAFWDQESKAPFLAFGFRAEPKSAGRGE